MNEQNSHSQPGRSIDQLVHSTANSLTDRVTRGKRTTNTADSSKRHATRGRPFARTGHPSTRPTSNSHSSESKQDRTTKNPVGSRNPLGSVICRACKALTNLYHVHKTGKCQTCTLGGKYFPHYALAFTTAALNTRREDEEHSDIRLARLTKDSVLMRRDLDMLASKSTEPTTRRPTKFQRFVIKSRAGLFG